MKMVTPRVTYKGRKTELKNQTHNGFFGKHSMNAFYFLENWSRVVGLHIEFFKEVLQNRPSWQTIWSLMTNQFTSHHKLLHSSLLGSHILLTNIHKFKINFAGGKQNIHFPYCCSHPFLICNCGIEYEISDINYVTNSTDANKVKHSHPMVRFPWCPIAVQYNMQ